MTKLPLVMGILNCTPDSFSDGGKYIDPDQAFRWAEALVKEGVDIIDVGGESTRPGAAAVSVQEELDRVLPILEGLRERFSIRLSIDTQKYEVAEQASRVGVSLINDVSGGRDIRMAELVAREHLEIILMHMKGAPRDMQEAPTYPHGVVHEIRDFLRWRVAAFEEIGVRREHIWVDPGIGFGKTLEHNTQILRQLDQFTGLGHRLVIGTSRKSFIAKALGDPELSFEKREAGTLASNLWAYQKGASVFRVHTSGEMARALKVWRVIAGDCQPGSYL